eukprot:TRINITY_DN4334_c0_g1_i2.p4 TRINITY_DN4334_c0_g1~~TRINITY_DN4334_c0_g1_i2.p4  ORF type:complete len:108 (-),score=9.43 TRINITY_DN4334_c0_g1_i2:231-554(-)
MVTSGMVTTNDTIEKIYSMILMVLLSGALAYVIGSVGLIFQTMYQNESELKYLKNNQYSYFYRSKIKDINHYMKTRNINKDLQTKIRRLINQKKINYLFLKIYFLYA